MPPTAAIAGSATAFGRRSSPLVTSRLISSPTSKKKRVMRPLPIQNRTSVPIERPLTRSTSGVVQRRSYPADHGEFAHTSATATATMSTYPDDVDAPRNCCNGRTTVRGMRRSERDHGARSSGCSGTAFILLPTSLPGTPSERPQGYPAGPRRAREPLQLRHDLVTDFGEVGW